MDKKEIKTAEEILDSNYNSFIGTRFSCENWEQPIGEDLKECILLCMDEYKNQELVIVDFPKTESELDLFNTLYANYPQVPNNEKINPNKIISNYNKISIMTILPCPFCGGEPEIKQIGKNELRLKCKSCLIGITQKVALKSLDWLEDKMIEAWNTRYNKE